MTLWRCPNNSTGPSGCKHCRETGYLGREGIYEVLVASSDVQDTITEHHSVPAIRASAMTGGMVPLRLAGAEKVIRGETTIEEVLRVAPAEER